MQQGIEQVAIARHVALRPQQCGHHPQRQAGQVAQRVVHFGGAALAPATKLRAIFKAHRLGVVVRVVARVVVSVGGVVGRVVIGVRSVVAV